MSRSPLDGTWMADAKVRRAVHSEVEQRISAVIRHARHPLPQSAPQEVRLLCEDLMKAEEARIWFLATCACALLAELIEGSAHGGVFPRASEDDTLLQCLYSLRNACFHPAHVNPEAGSGEPHVLVLATRLERWGDRREKEIAQRLREDYRKLRSEEMLRTAAKLVHALGLRYLARQRR